MNTPPKTMAEIRDAEAEEYCSFIKGPCDFEQRIFKAGFDCRDKLDNEKLQKTVEALKIAVEALENILSEYAEDVYDQDYNPHQNPAFRTANEALAEIRKLRGEK